MRDAYLRNKYVGRDDRHSCSTDKNTEISCVALNQSSDRRPISARRLRIKKQISRANLILKFFDDSKSCTSFKTVEVRQQDVGMGRLVACGSGPGRGQHLLVVDLS